MMRPWWLLAIRNWRASPGRTAGVMIAIAMGVATVVWVTCSYESARRSISERVVDRWVGRTHLSVESPLGHWGRIRQDVVETVRATDGVTSVTPRLKRRMNLVLAPGMKAPADEDISPDGRTLAVDAIGIDPHDEYQFRPMEVVGSLIGPEEHDVAVVEAKVAGLMGIRTGDQVTIEFYAGGPSRIFRVIGLYEAQRVAKFQKPFIYVNLSDLQAITGDVGSVTAVDAIVTDPKPARLELMARQLGDSLSARGVACQVTTSTARLNQLNEAQRHTRFALMMVSSVALLTAFFIITTTMSMGMSQRIRQLGLLRCVGATRSQLVWLILTETAAPGGIGLLLGVPIGLALTRASMLLAPQYVAATVVSWSGILFALTGGAATALASALAPAIQAWRTTPMQATRPRAAAPDRRWPWVTAVVGSVMVLAHTWMVRGVPVTAWLNPATGGASTALLYVGYALLTPLAVQLGGGIAVQVAARVLGLRVSLLNDQVGKAAWRGAGICCGLMVGLSLLISVAVYSESVRAGWDFPKRIAEAFVWTRDPVPRRYAEFAKSIPGVADCTVINEVLCEVGERRKGLFDALKLRSTFVAGDPDGFLPMTQLEFLEGSVADAYPKIRQGGYLLLAPEASRAFNLHLGDKVPIMAAGRTVTFEIAGVVQSPALDIAVNYFQADSYMMLAAAGSVLGTLDDVKKYFGIDDATLLLMNFKIPDSPPAALFESNTTPDVSPKSIAEWLMRYGSAMSNDPEEVRLLQPRLQQWLAGAAGQFDAGPLLDPYVGAMRYVADRWQDLKPNERRDLYFDQLVMRQVTKSLDRPNAIFGSVRQLKQHIDKDLREAALLLSAIPIVALLVAAIGVGNLMTANVLSRTREIAILRSSGATRWQVTRLVLGEAVVLGLIGLAAGLAVGLHAADSMSTLTVRLTGFAPTLRIPWLDVSLGVALTLGVCVLAGLSPARRASRSNIIDALTSA